MRRLPAPLPRVAALALAVAALAAPRALADQPPTPAPAPAPAPAPVPDEGRLFDPRFREGRPDDALRPGGDAPLHRRTIDAFVDLVEGSLDAALPADDEQALRDALESAWPSMGSGERAWFEAQADLCRSLREDLTRGAKDAVRDALARFSGTLLVRASSVPDGAWQSAVRAARERRDAVLVPGTPPVSKADVLAFEDLAAFVVCIARNADERPTLGQREQERPGLLKTMGEAGALVRGRYDRASRLWLLVKARWDRADDLMRQRMRAVVLTRFLGYAGMPLPDQKVALDLAAYARLASEVRTAVPFFEGYQRLLKEPGTLFDLVVEGLGLGADGLDAALDAPSIAWR
jgi:hypothetical protein